MNMKPARASGGLDVQTRAPTGLLLGGLTHLCGKKAGIGVLGGAGVLTPTPMSRPPLAAWAPLWRPDSGWLPPTSAAEYGGTKEPAWGWFTQGFL